MYSFRGRKNEHLIDRDQPVYEIGSGPSLFVGVVGAPGLLKTWAAWTSVLALYLAGTVFVATRWLGWF
jgi:hypothetical protein